MLRVLILTPRSDEPPAISGRVVNLAIRYGTITRAVARSCPMTINLTINRGDPEELPRVD